MLRTIRSILLVSSALQASSAIAADQLRFGKPPEWVVQQAIPADNGKSAGAPVSILLHDQQIRLEPGKVITYAEVAMKLQTPEGLAAGNVSLPWNPATDTVTVNKLQIRRGDKIIDVLASGQTFTTMRRESNLELAMLDGILTANIQPEGLQQGDIIELATTSEHVDPVLGKHVEANFGEWGASRIQLAHVHVDWPAGIALKTQAKGFPIEQAERGGRKVIDFIRRDVEPVIPPKGAPVRFSITRLGEATDFTSWAQVAASMVPLYRKAEVIPPSGPLHDELEKIRASTPDPKLRAAKALQLVQDRVRYVALLMGQGGYVPADAATTWSRRFGDCKAKTALLLGMLHELGIEAEPLLVQSRMGDAIAERLPLLSYFDHVLVRAHIGGKAYYLDGTRTGDTAIDQIEVPDFGWALPVLANAQLAQLVPPPLDRPQSETRIAIDASAGIYTPADLNVVQVIHGDLAVGLNLTLASLTEAQRKEFFDNYWKKNIDDDASGATSFAFDKTARDLRLSMSGKLKLDWTDGLFHLPLSSIGYTPDLDRPAGPLHDAPVAVSHPIFMRTETKLRMPAAFFPANIAKLVPKPSHATLIGIEYSRVQSATPDGMTVETMTRSLIPEVSYKDAVAASGQLKTLAYGDVSVRLPSNYRPSEKDVVALGKAEPVSADDFVTRGNRLMTARKFDQAIADFTKALSLDPKDVTALADRGIAYVWTNKFDLADKDLDAALALEPENAIALRARGLKAESAGDCAAAVEAYTRSLQAEPQNGFALGHRAICENLLGHHPEAISDAALAVEKDPSWGQLHLVRLDSFARLGQKDDAAREAELLVKENSQTASAAWIAVGSIFARAGLRDEAAAAFDKSLAIKPEPSTYVARARIRPSSDFNGRMADIDAALKLEPTDSEALTAKAELLADQADLKAAVAVYDRALKSGPAQSPLSLSRAVLLYKLGRTSEAQRLLSEWRRRARTATELNEICWKKATAGILLESAVKDCNEALQINPNYTPAIDSLAFVNLRLGKFNEAVTLYDRALAKSPFPASYMGRALAFRRLGNTSKANADRSEAIRRDAGIEDRFERYGLKFDDAAAGANP